MARSLTRPARLRGTVHVPGDKSVSHRAALLGALASGRTTARRFLVSADTLATLDCLRALGVKSRLSDDGTLEVDGVGLRGLREPDNVLDAQNSMTTVRLLSGILAGQPFLSVLTGDGSLRQRPVDRVVEPLRRMGAQLNARAGDRLPPLAIRGGDLRGIRFKPPVPTAQVKSAVLLAGLFAQGETVVEESIATRDHTERMLHAMGADLRREGPGVRLTAPESLAPLDIEVPGDVSAAAFWLVLGVAHPDAEITLPKVGLNPTRTGLIEVLRMMGAEIDIGEERTTGDEPVGDITVRSAQLHGVEVSGDLMPGLDEAPALAVAAALAQGRTVLRDAAELRVKESDRIAAVVQQLSALGAKIEERPDGFAVEGGGLRGASVTGAGDHRLTMALAVAGLLADGETVVEDDHAVQVSYPAFWQDVERIA